MTDTKVEQETWQNVTEGTVVLKRTDHRGEMTKEEVIIGGRNFHITSNERRLNQEMAADEGLDVFRNGTLHPLRLMDDTEEAREIAANPNLMSESDMKEMVRVHPKTFEKQLSSIANATTLQRLLAMAHSEDASIKRVEAIEARLAVVAPTAAYEVRVAGAPPAPPATGDSSAPGMRPVTPR